MATKTVITEPCGKRILYVCPATMINNVVNECRLWSPQRNPVVIGGQTKETRRFLLDIMVQTDQYFCVVNYEAWRKDNSLLKDLTDIGKFDTIIIDEAHNVKDRKS